MIEFVLTSDYIELIKLLKKLQLAESGGVAKMLVEDGLVKLNEVIEYRKRAKVRRGDVVEFDNQIIRVI